MNAVARAERARLLAEAKADVPITLDGRAVQARAGETLLEVARRVGVEIPHLCWSPGLDAAGNCRACVVEVNQERTLAASCCRKAEAGMTVQTASERARRAQKLVLEDVDGATKSPVERLSEREFDVFLRLANGATVQRIAEELNLSASTVGTHLYNIKQKLAVANQSELTLIAIRHGLIET